MFSYSGQMPKRERLFEYNLLHVWRIIYHLQVFTIIAATSRKKGLSSAFIMFQFQTFSHRQQQLLVCSKFFYKKPSCFLAAAFSGELSLDSVVSSKVQINVCEILRGSSFNSQIPWDGNKVFHSVINSSVISFSIILSK